MAAPLITRTPIHDDDGSGTTGTIIDNAWKQELYGQIDADVAAVVAGIPPSNVLLKMSGSNAATGPVTLASFVMPPLGGTDYVKVVLDCYQLTQAGTTLTLGALGDSTLIRLDDIGGGSLAVNNSGMFEVTLRMNSTYPGAFRALAIGGVAAAGAGAGQRQTLTYTNASNWNSGGWTLALQGGGQTAGGTQYFGVAVLRF